MSSESIIAKCRSRSGAPSRGRRPAPGPQPISRSVSADSGARNAARACAPIQAPRFGSQGRCALLMDEGTTPKYFRKTRLKCDELEKPQEKAKIGRAHV